MKFKVKRGYNAPVPGQYRPMPYEVYGKKFLRRWKHLATFDSEDEAYEYIEKLSGKNPDVG